MAGGGEGESTITLEYTPTWVVACVCTLIVGISLAVERAIHYTGKACSLSLSLNKHKYIYIVDAFRVHIATSDCIPKRYNQDMCKQGKKDQLVSVEALHHLHIFIFVLAIVHVTFNALTVVFGGAKIREWKHWEDSIAKENYDTEKVKVADCLEFNCFHPVPYVKLTTILCIILLICALYCAVLGPRITDVHQHDFIRGRFWGIGKNSAFLGWLVSSYLLGKLEVQFSQVYDPCLEDDFKKVVGVRQVIAEISFLVSMDICCHLFVAEHQWMAYIFLDSFHPFHCPFYCPQACYRVLCSYSTLPLYAIVTQMGSTFKKSIFEEHVQVGLVGWAQKVKKKKAANNGSRDGNSSSTDGSTARIQLGRVTGKESHGEEIRPTTRTRVEK
ncbi:hypothetical protein C3L33_04420, partial [Rhododendron williamsianum]